ncbi:MAG: hypothetical protein ACLFR7_09980 [Opitutales bacterium]
MKSSDPVDHSPDPPEVDRVVIHAAMKKCGGNIEQAHRLLKSNGMTSRDRKWLDRILHKDAALKAVWIDQTSEYSLIEMPTQLAPEEESALQEQMVRREQEFVDAQNIDDVFGENAGEVISFARFAEQSFSKSINIVHGLSVKSAVDLAKRAEWIAENVLLNEDIVKKTHITDDGTKVEFDAPKYSEADKLDWQKEYTSIMAELRKFGEAGNQAALARIRAREVANRIDDGDGRGGSGGKSARGKRAFKG